MGKRKPAEPNWDVQVAASAPLTGRARAAHLLTPKVMAKVAAANRAAAWAYGSAEWIALQASRSASKRSHQLRKTKACPAWADREKIAEIYTRCLTLSRQTGERYEVDHKWE